MSNPVNGRFYFKQTTNGNLIGEFSNDQSGNDIITESADLLSGSTNVNFIGDYNSTWQERGTSHFAHLVISLKTGCSRVFTLTWTESDNVVYEGEGMLCDKILIGNYWST